MPDFAIVDAHVHFSKPQRVKYSWMADAPALNRPFSPDDFRTACGHVDVESMVFVEVACDAEYRSAEVEWVAELAPQQPQLKAIVAQAPLEHGESIQGELESLAGNPLVKGIRRLLQTEDVEFCLQDGFLNGLRLLPQFNFSFDICAYHRHLPNVVEMARRCGEVRFVLDHVGKPDIKSQLFDPWKANIQSLAELPNVVCKLSGMATEADHQSWTPQDLRPYIDHVVACFGCERMMFGGDWFVSTLATTYPRWVETVDAALAGASEAELRRLYRENAQKFYRMAEADGN